MERQDLIKEVTEFLSDEENVTAEELEDLSLIGEKLSTFVSELGDDEESDDEDEEITDSEGNDLEGAPPKNS